MYFRHEETESLGIEEVLCYSFFPRSQLVDDSNEIQRHYSFSLQPINLSVFVLFNIML
jgi:hypothetical protein